MGNLMNPKIHKLSGRFCPFCLRALHQVIETGFEFCPGNPMCEYEVCEGASAPLSDTGRDQYLLDKKRGEIELCQQRIATLSDECLALEKKLAANG